MPTACLILAAIAVALQPPQPATPPTPPGPVAFVNARVFTADGDDAGEIARGIVVIDGGKVIAVGAADGPGAIQPPVGAQVIDCAGKVIMPGLVDTHSHIGGVGGADGSGPIQPDVRIYDSINVNDSGFRRAVAGGLTTLNVMAGSGHLMSGQTAYLKLRMPGGARPRTIDEWFILDGAGRPMGGMKMANGTNPMRDPPFAGTRGKAAALVRQQWLRAIDYRDKVRKAEAPAPAPAAPGAPANQPQPAAPAPPEATPAGVVDPSAPVTATAIVASKLPDRDIGLDAMTECLAGTRIVQHHTHRADDIITVLRLAREFGYRVVLHHVSEAWKVADEIAQAQRDGVCLGCSVILVDSPGGKLEAAEITFDTGAILDKAGVRIAYHTDDWITDSRLFLRMGALGVRAGLSRAAAVKSLTINGAALLGLESRTGSLTPGKDADLVILSGDLFSVYTKVEQTWVEGRKVFDRADPADRLMADGGFGAGRDQQPYLCCAGGAVFAFGGQQWMMGSAAAQQQGGGK